MTVALIGTTILTLVGWWLRRVLPPRGVMLSIVPAAILGGLVALALRAADVLPGDVEAWQDAAYHLFGISFLAIGLTPTGKTRLRKGALWMGIGQWATFSLQAAAGGLVVLVVSSLHEGFGFLAPMGLNEGPGQALSIGRLWEADYGFTNAASIGATIASLGFLIAYAGGLLVVRGRSAAVEPVLSPGRFSRSTLFFSAAITIGYVISYQAVFHAFGLIGEDIRDLVLAVMFFVALLIGMAIRTVLERRGYRIDGYQTRLVTVLAVDGLTVAILGSLTWEAVSDVIGPMLAVVALALAATAAIILPTGRWLGRWRMERSLALFGTVTGTAASGLALLTLVDRDLESPVAAELGAMVIVSAPVVAAGIALATATASGAISTLVGTAAFAAIGATSIGVLAWTMKRVEE